MSDPDDVGAQPPHATGTANSVGAVIGSSMVQAGTIHGGVHFHAPPGVPVVPQQLPPPPSRFAGRARELEAITERFSTHIGDGPPVIVLRGQTGVGKSAVALRWLHQFHDTFPDGRLYAELTQPDGKPVPVSTVLGLFLRALGIAPDRVPATETERISLFRTLTADKTLALLLDDVYSAAQVRAVLPTSGRCAALVTTRKNAVGLLTFGADELLITPMDDEDALDLLRAYLGDVLVDADPDTAHQLVHLCAGLPMALCVAAALTASRPRHTMRRMVERLSDDDRRLDLLSVDDASVRAALDVSYQDLSPQAAAVYRALGAHPGTRVTLELVAAAAVQHPDDAADAMDELLDANLLADLTSWDADPDCVAAYRLHDLARLHARDEAMTAGEFDQVAERVDSWFEFVATAAGTIVMPARRKLPVQRSSDRHEVLLPAGFGRRQVALRWFDDHLADLIAVMRDAAERGNHEVACRLGDAVQPLFTIHKNYPEAVAAGEIALASAIAWPDPGAEHNMRKRLARTYATLGEFDKARLHGTAMLDAADRRGDRSRQGSAHKALGMLAARSGSHAEAMTSFDRTVTLYRELGKTRSVGLVLIERGASLIALDELRQAGQELTQARQLLATLDPPDDYNAARAEILLSAALSSQGDHEHAHRFADHALTVFDALGSLHEKVRAHRVMADNLDRQGRVVEAVEHRVAAVAIEDPQSENAD
jgi:tetratricopeptide (TPR) repeat protein